MYVVTERSHFDGDAVFCLTRNLRRARKLARLTWNGKIKSFAWALRNYPELESNRLRKHLTVD